MASFSARTLAAAAWRSWHWDSLTKLGPLVLGVENPAGWGINPSPDYPSAGWDAPTIDLTQGCDSGGALMVTQNSLRGAGTGGLWFARFSDDESIQVGPPGERPGARQVVYMQVRVKWNHALATTAFVNATNGGPINGIKFMNISTGMPHSSVGTSSDTKQVIQTINSLAGIDPARRIFHAYYYGLGHNTHVWADNGLNYQNQQASPYCSYSSWANCVEMVEEEWVTLTMRYENLGRAAGNPDYCDFMGDFWVQFDGASRVKVIHWEPGMPDYEPSVYGDPAIQQTIGYCLCDNYITDKSPTQVHSPGIAWFDQLIVGPNDPGEADPATFDVSSPPPPPASPTRRSRVRVV